MADLKHNQSSRLFAENGSQGTPSTGLWELYFDSTGGHIKDDAGAVTDIGSGETSAAKETITQVSHGFAAGDAIKFDSGSWSKAQADSVANAEALGIVESVNGNDFVIVYSGRISSLSGLTQNSVYFLDASTAGALTTTEPAISKPILVATSTTSGIVMQMRGMVADAGDITKKHVSLSWSSPGEAATTGTAKAYFRVPASMNGMDLVTVNAHTYTAGTGGTETFDINKNGTSMLSTLITIDSTETNSSTAATPPVINTAQDNVSEGDIISVDVDAIHSTTAAKGEMITLEFDTP